MPDDALEPAESNDPPAVVNKTKVALRADMTIDDEPVGIEGVIGGSFFLQLDKPARLGTPISFAYWLRDTYGVENLDVMLPTDYPDSAAFKADYRAFRDATSDAGKAKLNEIIDRHLVDRNIPKPLHTIMKSALLAELKITDLLIDIKEGENGAEGTRKMMFGLSMAFPSPLPLIPNIDVNKLSILIMNAPENDFTFPERVQLPPPAAMARATGSIAFSAQPDARSTITLGDDTWTFIAKSGKPTGRQVPLGGTLDDTLAALAAALNAQAAGDTAKCKYRATLDESPKRLDIAFKAVGSAGNAFALAAGPKSKGTVSGDTLKGGTGEPIETYAMGSVRFAENAGEGGKLKLNGVEWELVTGASDAAARKSQIGATPQETAGNLATALGAATDAEIRKCRYTARGAAVLITFKETGTAGNEFTLAADTTSKAKVSGATLTGGA
jgi:hypothetical protein